MRRFLKGGDACANKYGSHRPQGLRSGPAHSGEEPQRMSSAGITFDGRDVIGKLAAMFLLITAAARAVRLFIHPRNQAQRSLWAKVKLLEKLCSFHRHHHAGSIVESAR